MQIDGLIINADVQDIVSKLKLQLADQNISLFNKMFESETDLMVCCPYHKNGQERRPSAGIRKSDGLFHCLACGETHSLPEVINHCFGYKETNTFGYKWLLNTFNTSEVAERGHIILNNSRLNNANVRNVSSPKVSEAELDKYRYTHRYMYERGLTDAVIDLFDIGYDKSTDCITFPVRDINGDCLFVARRNVSFKRFDIPKGIEKPLYGLYEVNQHIRLPEIYVCEGLFDCLRLWSIGKFAVAGFGCLFSEYQISQINSLPTRKIVLALDNDDAGYDGALRLKRAIKNKLIVRAEIPSSKKDIGELTDEELQNLSEKFY